MPSTTARGALPLRKPGIFIEEVHALGGGSELLGDQFDLAESDIPFGAQRNQAFCGVCSVIDPGGGFKQIDFLPMHVNTNKDLNAEIQKGTFREDLFHRLNVIPIAVPALDNRKEDIPLLVDYFLQQIEEEGCSAPKTFAPEAIKALQELSWPGNIRQLRNVVERLFILSATNTISAEDIHLYA